MSVESALHVTDFVETNLARGEYTLEAFLDIEKAFSNVTTSSTENSRRNILKFSGAVYHAHVG